MRFNLFKPDGVEVIFRYKHIEVMHLQLKSLHELAEFMRDWINKV